MPSTKCCRSCPRCADCPVLVAARTRRFERESGTISALVDEVFGGLQARTLPEPVTRALEALDEARRPAAPALAALRG